MIMETEKTPPPEAAASPWELHQCAEIIKWYSSGAIGPFPNSTRKRTTPEERQAIIADA
jgi:hypothetical protein